MCITVMRMYDSKQKPTIIHYRKFNNFVIINKGTIPLEVVGELMNITLEENLLYLDTLELMKHLTRTKSEVRKL